MDCLIKFVMRLNSKTDDLISKTEAINLMQNADLTKKAEHYKS